MAIVFKTPISTLNTTTKDIQNIKQGDCPPCPECPEVKLESGEANYTENGEYTLTPKGDGFSKVDITVNVDTETPYNEGYAAGETAGIATGKAEGIAEQKAKLTSGTFVSNGTYTREDGYNEVTVNVPSDVNNQDKTVDPLLKQFTITADNGYSGLGQVTINAVTSAIDSNIQPENIVDGVTILGVTGEYTPNTTNIDITENGRYDALSAGYDGYQNINVNVPMPTLAKGKYNAESIGIATVEPSVDGFSSVDIIVPTDPIGSGYNPFINIETVLNTDFEEGYFEASIASGEINRTTGYYDAVEHNGTVFHIKPYLDNPDYDPENPDSDVPEFIFPEDFDLTDKYIIISFNKANVSQINNQTKAPLLRAAIIYEFNDCTLAAIDYDFEPYNWPFGTLDVTENGTVDPTGYAVINVDVQPTLQTKSVTPSDRQLVVTPDRDYDGLSEVTVSGVTAAIDQNITASNIKNGVTILGVTGTYDPQPSLESKTASYTANGTYTITPSTGYDGMSDVEVTVNVSGGSGTQCPDWSSIGWDCSDVTGSGIDADLAYTAQIKTEYENGRGHLGNADRLVYAPKITNLPNNCSEFFVNDSKLRYVPLLNTSNVTDMQRMFAYCSMLKTVPLFNTSNVTKMNSMFTSCSNLEYISAFDTSNVTNMNGMFQRCNILSTIPLLDTSSVTDMSYMFNYAKMLNGANLPLLDTSNVTNMEGMFSGVNGQYLTTIPQFNTSKVTTMKLMFDGCDYLTTIPQLNTASVQSVDGIFGQYSYMACTALTTIGGFVNLGKGFISTGTANDHRLNLQ